MDTSYFGRCPEAKNSYASFKKPLPNYIPAREVLLIPVLNLRSGSIFVSLGKPIPAELPNEKAA